jgi:hypothetical protein
MTRREIGPSLSCRDAVSVEHQREEALTDSLRGVMTPPGSSAPVMRFGRHRGRPIADLPDTYLLWLLSLDTLWAETAAAIRAEWHRRAGRRRSWRPVARAKWGRRLLDVQGQGPFAVVQPCGGFGLWTVVLSPTLEQAWEKRPGDCGWDGSAGCVPQLHSIVNLLDLSRVPGEAIT